MFISLWFLFSILFLVPLINFLKKGIATLEMSIIDLHICPNSIKSDETTLSDSCECPPEYYCLDFCGEAGSLSTLISWQHFPRSTSSRSRCDESSEEARASLTETVTPSLKVEEKESVQVSSTDYPITKSFAQLQALHYLEIRYVFPFLNFLMSHLVCNEPEDPVQFLVNLLNKCLRYRNRLGEPPLLFTHSHVKSLYNAFDPFERGYLTLEQYREAMKALGLVNGPSRYNQQPPLNEEGFVNESDFIFEANNRLLENLNLMLRIPRKWEENRVLWKRKMERRRLKELKKKEELCLESEPEEEEEEVKIKKTPPRTDCPCTNAPNWANVKNLPEQLFLD